MTIYVLGSSTTLWADMRAKVRGDLWRPGEGGVPQDVVDRALHAALLELEGETRWLWLEEIQTDLAIGANAADGIEIPANVASVNYLSVKTGATKDLLVRAPLATVRELSQTSPGIPTMYAMTDGLFYFDSIVPALTAFELVFTAQTPELLADAIEAPGIALSRHQQPVIALACHYVALTFLKNTEEAVRQRAAYDSMLARMLERDYQQKGDLGGGGIQPDNGLAIAAFGYGG